MAWLDVNSSVTRKARRLEHLEFIISTTPPRGARPSGSTLAPIISMGILKVEDNPLKAMAPAKGIALFRAGSVNQYMVNLLHNVILIGRDRYRLQKQALCSVE
jgi:hypothetical protein